MSGLDPHPGVKLTYDDFLLFPDDGLRHELIDGVHVVSASPNTKHQTVLVELLYLVRTWLETHPIGTIFVAPFDVVLSKYDVVEPDLLYMSNERSAEILNARNVCGVPEIVVEILSPGTDWRDETLKKELYERVGVAEYWIVDPFNDRILVYRHRGRGFGAPTILSRDAGDVLTTALLPGLELELSRIF